MNVRISAHAQRDLTRIIGWIAQDDPAAAVHGGNAPVAKAPAIADAPLAFLAAGVPGRPALRKRVRQTVAIMRFVPRGAGTCSIA